MTAEQKSPCHKSEEIRQLLKLNPKISGKEAIEVLEQQGITIPNNLFYLVKGKVMGRKHAAAKRTARYQGRHDDRRRRRCQNDLESEGICLGPRRAEKVEGPVDGCERVTKGLA